MPSFGYYRRKIYKTVFLSGILVFLLVAVLLGITLSNQRKHEYLRYLSSSSSVLETNASVSMAVISKAINEITMGDSLTDLTTAATYPEFLYKSLQVAKQIKKSITDLNTIDYDLSIAMLNPPLLQGREMNYIISSNSVNEITEYLNITPELTPEMIEQVSAYFQTNTRPFLLPQYEQDSIKNFFYFNVQKVNQHSFLFILTIPRYTLLGDTSALSTMVYDSNKILAVDSTGFQDDFNALHQALIDTNEETNHFYFNKYPVVISSIAGSPWKVAYIYEQLNYSYNDIFFLLVSIFLFLCIGIITMKMISDQLYKPVKEVLNDTVATLDRSSTNNEFELIRQNNAKMQLLGQELSAMEHANNELISQQSYQELLLSATVNQDSYSSLLRLDKNYCVALFDLTNGHDAIGTVPIQKGILYDYALQNPSIHYASINQNRCCLILQCNTVSDAKLLIFTALHHITSPDSLEHTDPYVALSNLYSGFGILHKCYLETIKILDYHVLFPTAKIITYDQIEPWDTVMYSYPLSTENKLVQYTLNGKVEAIQLFDRLIRENIRDKNLPTNTMQNLIYALIGTIIRIFGELKTTPEDFLQETIDFKYFYDNWNKPATITMIKSTLEKIISTVNSRKSSANQELLQQMLQYIYDNYWDNIMLNDMADHFNISPKYCGILFKELSDDNFKNFLNNYRIERAKEMLEANSSIKIQDLSKQVGFNSPNSFLRVFRKYTGLTPTDYIERIVHQ